MRVKTQSSNVSSSQRSACGASSLVTKLPIDSRSWSCSSVKMKCLRWAAWSGLRTSWEAAASTAGVTGLVMKVDSSASYFPRRGAIRRGSPAAAGRVRCGPGGAGPASAGPGWRARLVPAGRAAAGRAPAPPRPEWSPRRRADRGCRRSAPPRRSCAGRAPAAPPGGRGCRRRPVASPPLNSTRHSGRAIRGIPQLWGSTIDSSRLRAYSRCRGATSRSSFANRRAWSAAVTVDSDHEPVSLKSRIPARRARASIAFGPTLRCSSMAASLSEERTICWRRSRSSELGGRSIRLRKATITIALTRLAARYRRRVSKPAIVPRVSATAKETRALRSCR